VPIRPVFFPLFLVQLAGITAYAGWQAWPPPFILLFGALGVGFEIGIFGTEELDAARGHTFVFLLRKWAIDSVVAAAIYGAGFAIKCLLRLFFCQRCHARQTAGHDSLEVWKFS